MNKQALGIVLIASTLLPLSASAENPFVQEGVSGGASVQDRQEIIDLRRSVVSLQNSLSQLQMKEKRKEEGSPEVTAFDGKGQARSDIQGFIEVGGRFYLKLKSPAGQPTYLKVSRSEYLSVMNANTSAPSQEGANHED